MPLAERSQGSREGALGVTTAARFAYKFVDLEIAVRMFLEMFLEPARGVRGRRVLVPSMLKRLVGNEISKHSCARVAAPHPLR